MPHRFVAVFLVVLGVASAATIRTADPSPLRTSQNGRVLVDAGGRPVFLLVDTAWSLALRLSREDAEHFLQRRKQQGFNGVTFVLFAPGTTELTRSPANHYGDAPFELVGERPDPTRPRTTTGADPADAAQYDYWDNVDHLVARTRQLGLYAILLPTWGSGVVGSYDGKNARDIVFTAESARTYGAWLGQRYGGEPHVLWMMGGDRSAVNGERDSRPVFRALAGALAQVAPRQLISYHPRKAAPQSSAWFHDDAWLAFNSNQEWPDNQIRCVTEDWARTPPKPTWLFEGRYEGYWKGNYKPGDWGEWQVRQQAYQTVFAGAFGHTYGHERVFGFGLDQADWKAFLDAPGARSMTHLAALMRRLSAHELMSRVPAPELIDGDAGKAERVRSSRITATLAPSTGKAMFYSAGGRVIRVRMEKLPAATRFAFWFNPRRGTWQRENAESDEPVAFATDLRSGAGAPAREFTPPTSGDGEDWVLVLAATDQL